MGWVGGHQERELVEYLLGVDKGLCGKAIVLSSSPA